MLTWYITNNKVPQNSGKPRMSAVCLQFQGIFQDARNIWVGQTAQFVQAIKLIELSTQETHQVPRFGVQTHPAQGKPQVIDKIMITLTW